jgi:molybdopterin molybdotransferase
MSSSLPPLTDIRMRGFPARTEVDAVVALLQQRITSLDAEAVELTEAAGRVLAVDVTAEVPVPGFDRAAMDGYALCGQETFGADSYNPLEFDLVGESLPARGFVGQIKAGQAVRIMTGAPLPAGADAVLQAEAAEEMAVSGRQYVRVREAVPPGRHVGHIGEDIAVGTVALRAGRVLRPQDVGVLASLGATPVAVVRRPTVALLVTGDELLPCGAKPHGHRIVDSNSVMLAALVRRDGGSPSAVQMLGDRAEMIQAALEAATEDVVLLSGGTAVGVEDHAPRVLEALGELCVHGVALRPASPTGIGFLGRRPVFLLPGNPVSCLCAYDLFAGPTLRLLGGRGWQIPYRMRRLSLAHKITSMVGRVDYARVQIRADQVEPLAVSGASLLSSTTRADGFVLVPAELEGYAPGEEVEVYLY